MIWPARGGNTLRYDTSLRGQTLCHINRNRTPAGSVWFFHSGIGRESSSESLEGNTAKH